MWSKHRSNCKLPPSHPRFFNLSRSSIDCSAFKSACVSASGKKSRITRGITWLRICQGFDWRYRCRATNVLLTVGYRTPASAACARRRFICSLRDRSRIPFSVWRTVPGADRVISNYRRSLAPPSPTRRCLSAAAAANPIASDIDVCLRRGSRPLIPGPWPSVPRMRYLDWSSDGGGGW